MDKNVSEYTHDEIAEWCSKKIEKMGFPISFSNLTSATHSEKPDVLGFNSDGMSTLVEVKVSRSDFLADKKKPWRVDPKKGIGDRRVYLTPEGLLKPEEIPYGWLLWEIYGKKQPRLRIVKGREKKRVHDGLFSKLLITDKHITPKEYHHFSGFSDNKAIELRWMLKILHRAKQSGVDISKFSNNYRD